MIQMMKMKSSLDMFSYCENYRYKAVKLAYGYSDKGTSGNYDMTLILPEENTTIQNLLKSADASFWADVQSSMKQEFVDIKLPRFNIDLNINLNDILYELGVKSIFDPKNADFSKISEDLLYISFIKQVANISVDEAGTEAAAVSVAAMEVADAPGEEPAFKVFHADRPFLFAITEQTTGAILFLGCYR